ncbi:hypothetical protein LB565_13715 [Mesorhizobium sp. CA14]|uniref:hypothetical protein n=1 Tax=Mesorhizobium sp. CA14 TaxID=2876642 RepID=UPI001CC9399E|nr:hypothetical protein [Mesorhizobium sp. CA14]MBZ9849038.1 hypothetical protein [Mesorhizobium sp. CA14]
MDKSPYSNGGVGDQIIRAAMVAVAVFAAVRVHYVWYWQIAILVVLTIVMSVVYPAIRTLIRKRSS